MEAKTLRPFSTNFQQLAPHAACGVASFLLLLTMFIAGRRLGGAFESPLSLLGLLATTLVAGLCIVGVRTLQSVATHAEEQFSTEEASWFRVPEVAMQMLSASLLLLMSSISLPGSSFILTMGWLLTAIEVTRTWSPRVQGIFEESLKHGHRYIQRIWRPDIQQPYHAGHWPEQLILSLQRWRTADDTEIVSGTVRVELEPGQRHQSVHIAFCPPLKNLPYVELQLVEGPTARTQAGQVLPTGMRLDVKLLSPNDEPLSLLVEFSALAHSTSRAATQRYRHAA